MQDQNPFQSPSTASDRGGFSYDHFEVGAAFSDAWQAASENAGQIILLTLLLLLLVMIPGVLSIGILIPFFCYGYMKALFRIFDGEEAGSILASFSQFGVAFLGIFVVFLVMNIPSFIPNFLSAFLADASGGAAMAVGLLSLVGTIVTWVFAIKFVFGYVTVVDQEVGPMEALRSSWADTKGQALNALLLAIGTGIVGGVGILLFGIGILFTAPLGVLMTIAAYRQMHPRDERGGDFGSYAPDPSVGAGFDPYQS